MVKTALLSTGLITYFSRYLTVIKSRVLPVLLLSLLASCSTKQTPTAKTAPSTATELEVLEVAPDSLTAEERIEYAKTLEAEAAINELVIATRLLYQQHNHPKALWLADKTLPLIDDKLENYQVSKLQLSMIKASSLQALGYFPESHTELEKIAQFSSDNKIALSASYYNLLNATFDDKKRPIAALNARLHAFSLTALSEQNPQQVEQIWYDFQRLAQWQLSLLAKDNAPASKGWLELTALTNKFSYNNKQLQYHLKIWQNKFKLHPANVIAKQLTTLTLTEKRIENIAVILPLSGKQHAAGLAIQQGILASFANDEDTTIHFVDSNTVNWYGLSNEFSTLNIDYVIGPLLKSNVDKYITHTSQSTQSQNDYMLGASNNLFNFNTKQDTKQDTSLAKPSTTTQSNDYITAIDSQTAIDSYLKPDKNSKAIDTLLLNIPAKASLSDEHTVLSMRPEDEASQAAATLSRKNFQHPIVLSQKNIVSKRIAQAFVKQWHRITGDTIEIVYYDTGAQMQANIKASLAVDKSKGRIDKLKSRVNQTLKTQTRNRRDIDMIYLVGTPEQTRLVKPYIEVNISPFAQVIPVFASSRSHSTKGDYSTNSDLRGLTFTEIPWLLSNERNSELAVLSDNIWPKRSDGLSRLFAMGFDSYQLINKIPLMQQAQYLQHWGQTGVLKLDDNSILTRSLLWGSYQRNKVTSIAMD